MPTSTPIAEVVEELAVYIQDNWFIKFAELAEYLEVCDVCVDGDEALTGKNLGQPHVNPRTTLLYAVSDEYIQIVEWLFSTKPVMLEIGDPASFRSGEKPWYVTCSGSTDDV
jgi:hypothetical protein